MSDITQKIQLHKKEKEKEQINLNYTRNYLEQQFIQEKKFRRMLLSTDN